LWFSEQGETMECAVWKDEHKQTETAVSFFGFPTRKYYIYRLSNLQCAVWKDEREQTKPQFQFFNKKN